MVVKKRQFKSGITLIELMITVIAATIFILGITGILAAGHKNYQTMYRRTSQGVVPDAYSSRRAFDLIVRKSSIKRVDPYTIYSTPSNELYVYYYSDPNNISEDTYPDKYGHFYKNGTQFIFETGSVTTIMDVPSDEIPPHTKESMLILADTVSDTANSLTFTLSNHSITMVLLLDNETGSSDPLGTLQMVVTSTAIQHN